MAIIQNDFFGNHTDTAPDGADTRREGDNNLRNLAGSLNKQFPNLTEVVTAQAARLNAAARTNAGETISANWTFSANVTLAGLNTDFTNATPRLVATVGSTLSLITNAGGSQILFSPVGTTVLALSQQTVNVEAGIQFSRGGQVQPNSNFCLNIINGNTTINNASGGASSWTASIINTQVMQVQHSLGTTAYVVVSASDVLGGAISNRTATTFDINFASAGPHVVDLIVMLS